MRKTGKKINKFIWFYWKMKKKYFFGGFPVVGMRGKKKQNKVAGSRLGYCPIFSKFVSQYSKLYCDRQG